MPDDSGWFEAPEIVPRRAVHAPRCSACKSDDRLQPASPPMFHPSHQPGECSVRLPGGGECECEGEANE